MTLRWRITLATAALIAIAASAIGAASYFSISRAQLTAIDSTLEGSLGAAPGRTLERENSRRGTDRAGLYSPIALAVVNRGGELLVVRPAGTAENPENFPAISQSDLLAGQGRATTISDPTTGSEYRLITRPAGRGLTAVVVTSLSDYNTTMNQILVSIVLFALGVTGLGALASWLLVRRFFQPVDSMIAAAGAIAQGDTSMRVPGAREGTELGDLSTSLNSMIIALTDSIDRVEKSEASLRKFVSDASHEIRTPLTVIRGYAEILISRQSQIAEADKRALERIDSESKRLERLVTSLLALEAKESRAFPATPFKLDQVVTQHFTDLATITAREVKLDIEPVEILGDRDSWEQLLGNITQNIDRYTPPHSEVAVSLTCSDREGDNLAVLTIDDSGPGIPAGMRYEIFSRFTRLDQSRSTQTGGFGLGMSIVKAVVDAHDGTIELGDSPQGGLQIKIEVPCI